MFDLTRYLLYPFFAESSLRILELEKDVAFYQYISYGLWLLILILSTVVYLQRRKVYNLKLELADLAGPKMQASAAVPLREVIPDKTQTAAHPNAGIVATRDLPDPGLLFKFSLTEEIKEKLITIGQTEGTIKTYSTEVIDNHMSIFIKLLEDRERDIYALPDQITEKYLIELRRDGKTQYYHAGMENYQEMPSRMRIYIRPQEESEDEDPSFASLDVKNPVRFRLGERISQEDKFVNGFFEFHLITQDKKVKTQGNIVKTEKQFVLRLYRIYPGYDTGSPTADGLFPMVDPFTSK